VTLPLSYSRLRAAPLRPSALRRGKPATSAAPLHPSALRRGKPASSCTPLACPAEARSRVASERRLVARGGFEPPKPLGRQIYSLLRLTAPQPRRRPINAPVSHAHPAATARTLLSRPGLALCGLKPARDSLWTDQGPGRAWLEPPPSAGSLPVEPWSWRRDLNPRPADYKSAALPD
jgi:hypothetical protein